MVKIFRNGEAVDGLRLSDRGREGSSRLQLQLRVGVAPWRVQPTEAGVHGQNVEVQNLGHPLSTTGKVTPKPKSHFRL